MDAPALNYFREAPNLALGFLDARARGPLNSWEAVKCLGGIARAWKSEGSLRTLWPGKRSLQALEGPEKLWEALSWEAQGGPGRFVLLCFVVAKMVSWCLDLLAQEPGLPSKSPEEGFGMLGKDLGV